MDPIEVKTVDVKSVRTGTMITIPVELERSYVVCPAARQPFDLVYGRAMERYSDGEPEPLVVQLYDTGCSPATTEPAWVAMYRTPSNYLLDIHTRHVCVIFNTTPGNLSGYVEEYYKHYVEEVGVPTQG